MLHVLAAHEIATRGTPGAVKSRIVVAEQNGEQRGDARSSIKQLGAGVAYANT